MPLFDSTKVDFAFKILNGKVESSTFKQFYEEARPSSLTIHRKDIWIDDIPPNPTDAVNLGIAKKYTLLTLTEDITVGGHKGWYAFENGKNITGWISPSFGQGYTVRLYDANNNEIVSSDPMDWLWQYNPGYLFIQNDHLHDIPFKITGYVYTGAILSATSGIDLYWKEPVQTYNDLPLTGNFEGDVRLVLELNRPFRWDQNLSQWIKLSVGSEYWKDPVDTYADLPLTGNLDGDIRYVKDLTDSTYGNKLYRWNSSTSNWVMVQPGTHFHDDRYYTKSELDPAASIGNNVLDDRYFTESELLNGALNTVHPTWADWNAIFDWDTGHRHKGVAGDGPKISFNDLIDVPDLADAHWKAPVATKNLLPSSGNLNGDVRLVLDTNDIYEWNASAGEWILISAGIERWNLPVNTYNDLPPSGEVGEIRLVLNEKRLYEWTGTQWAQVEPGIHIHDDRYYTKADLDPSASIGNNVLDSRYYTQDQIDILFDPQAGHKHTGQPGDAPQIDFNDLINVPTFGYYSWREPVETSNELPLTGNLDADTRLVKSENVIYRWNESLAEWQPVTSIQWQERFELYSGQTVINLTHSYEVGADDILVFLNGILGTVNQDYVETSPNSITLLSIGEIGDRVTIIGKAKSGGYQPKYTYEEKIVTVTEAANDEVESDSSILPTIPADQMISPSELRANNIIVKIVVNGVELYDDNYRYYYDSVLLKKLFKFSGTGFAGKDLQENDKIKIEIWKF